MTSAFKYGADDASNPRERVRVLAKLQQRACDEERRRLLECELAPEEIANNYLAIDSALQDTNGLYPEYISVVPTKTESQAASEARKTFGIESIVFNANGGPRGTSGNVKGSRARRRSRIQQLIERSKAAETGRSKA